MLAGTAGLPSPLQTAPLWRWERSLLLGLSRYLPCLGKSGGCVGLEKAFCCLLCRFSLVWQNTPCRESDRVGESMVVVHLKLKAIRAAICPVSGTGN